MGNLEFLISSLIVCLSAVLRGKSKKLIAKKDRKMKKVKSKMLTLLSAMFMIVAINANSQNIRQVENNNETYKILNAEKFTDVDNYIRALNKADFSHHRLRDVIFIIRFENGLEVEIFSAANLQSKNILAYELSFYPEKYAPERHNAVFKLGENDMIIETRPTSITK